jgi:hypothetical protein
MKNLLLLFLSVFLISGLAQAQIEIDGDMLDWTGIPAADVGQAAEELGDMVAGAGYDSVNFDMQDLYITGNDSMVFMRVDFNPEGSLVTAATEAGGYLLLSLYLDTDVAAGSGLDWGWWSLSFDYLIDLGAVTSGEVEEVTILNNIERDLVAPTWPTGWDSVGVCQVAMSATETQIELGFSKDVCHIWQVLRPMFEVTPDWANADVIPNHVYATDPGWLIGLNSVTNESYVYQAKGPQIDSEITIDGDMLDWSAGFQIDVNETAEEIGDMPTGPDFDIQDMYMTSDSDYVYIRIVIDPSGTFSGQWTAYTNDPVFELQFDTHLESQQGLSWGNWWFLGGDYKINLPDIYNPDNPKSETALWKFTGDYEGAEESYDSVGTVMATVNSNDNEIEVAISRSLLMAGSDIRPFIYSVGDENWDNEEYFPNDLPDEGQQPAYVVNYQFVEATGAANFMVVPDPTAIGHNVGSSTPTNFVLHQNYPNPFNPSTNIAFALPVAQKVSVVVFDVLGRKVSTLVNNERLNAGTNVVTWNGTNETGNLVSSGIYFYEVRSDDFNATKKMVLMK